MARSQRREPSASGQISTTIEELVLHLREAGAKRVYLSKENAFQNGTLSIIATFECQSSETEERVVDSDDLTSIIDQYSGPSIIQSEDQSPRERLTNVFTTIGERIWFASEEWDVEWEVTPAFTELPTTLVTLYDRGLEHKQGDGFHLRSLLFVYEQYQEMCSSD